jgi:uncharacterized membrane protein
MSSGAKWWARVSAAMTGAVLTMVIPAYAWAASNGVLEVATEVKKVKKRGGLSFIGVLGLLCCLVVVGGIVLAVVLIMKRRKRP